MLTLLVYVSVVGTVTDDGATHDGDVTFTGDNYNIVWDKSDNALEFGDDAKLTFGGDFEIRHSSGNDATSNNIIESGIGTSYCTSTKFQC